MTPILFLILGLYMTQKRHQSAEEAAITKEFSIMIQSKAFSPAFEWMHSEGLVNPNGELSKEGIILAKKLLGKARNPRQLNFELLVSESTPGYNVSLGLTAMNAFFDQVDKGICKKVTPELEQSIADLCDRSHDFMANITIEEKRK